MRFTGRLRTGDGVTFARSCLVPEDILPACVNQHVAIIRLNPALCLPGYLLSYLTHPLVKVYIESFNAGGSRRAITKGHIGSFLVPLPSLPQQRRIVDILGLIDKKIDLNWQINKTLEAMARAIFKSWFVDFGPVREGHAWAARTLTHPAARVIPEGWKVMSLDSIAMFLNGLAMQRFPAEEGEDYLPVIKIAELRKGDTKDSDRAGMNIPTEYVVEDGDVLFSWSGSLEVVEAIPKP